LPGKDLQRYAELEVAPFNENRHKHDRIAEEQCSDVRAFLGFFWDFLWNFKAPNFRNFLGIFLRIFWTSIFLVNFLEIFWEIFSRLIIS